MTTTVKRLVASIATVATLVAGFVFALPVFAADPAPKIGTPYGKDDDFESGDVKTDHPVSLTVTKYLSMDAGAKATGSASDASNIPEGDVPAAGIMFQLTKIVPTTGHSADEFTPDNGSLSIPTPSDPVWKQESETSRYYGYTNQQGQITDWYGGQDVAITSVRDHNKTNAISLSTSHSYYFLHELGRASMDEKNHVTITPLDGYERSEDSIFDLPYRATNNIDGKTFNGYVYHLSLFPKNVSKSSLTKTLVKSELLSGNGFSLSSTPAKKNLVQAGDVLTYDIAQKIYTNAEDQGNDSDHNQKLSLGEIGKTKQNGDPGYMLKITDRLSSALVPWNPEDNSSAVIGSTKKGTTTPQNISNSGLDWHAYEGSYISYSKNGVTKKISLDNNSWALQRITYGQEDTGRLGSQTGKMFNLPDSSPKEEPQYPGNDTIDGIGTHYIDWYLFDARTHSSDNTSTWNELNASGVSNIVLHILLHVKVTGNGDSVGHRDGQLVNDVASDVRGAKGNPITNSAMTPSAGFEFGKTGADSKEPLAGAVFRLSNSKTVDKNKKRKYLGDDGSFHDDDWYAQNPYVQPVSATSNNRGTVDFVGLPVMNENRSDWNCWKNGNRIAEADPDKDNPNPNPCWDPSGSSSSHDSELYVVEYAAPDGYKRATDAFGTLDFLKIMTSDADFKSYYQTLDSGSRILPNGNDLPNLTVWPGAGEADSSSKYPLDFSAWKADSSVYNNGGTKDGSQTTVVTTITGDPIYIAMRNFVDMKLPLAGGIGILLLLLVGIVIMVIIIIEHRRRVAVMRTTETAAA